MLAIAIVIVSLAVVLIAGIVILTGHQSMTLTSINEFVNETQTGDNITAYSENAILAAGYLPDSMAFVSDQINGPNDEGAYKMTMHSVVINCIVAGQVNPPTRSSRRTCTLTAPGHSSCYRETWTSTSPPSTGAMTSSTAL
jgi:hypothetical protein